MELQPKNTKNGGSLNYGCILKTITPPFVELELSLKEETKELRIKIRETTFTTFLQQIIGKKLLLVLI